MVGICLNEGIGAGLVYPLLHLLSPGQLQRSEGEGGLEVCWQVRVPPQTSHPWKMTSQGPLL